VGLGLDPRNDAAAFERRRAVAVMPEAFAQRVRLGAQRPIDIAFLDTETEHDVIV
jgi:hypothetical protein